MTNNDPNVNQLLEKVDALIKRQNEISQEINNLRGEIHSIKTTGSQPKSVREEAIQGKSATVTGQENQEEKVTAKYENRWQQQKQAPPDRRYSFASKPLIAKTDLEKFIGENLINKIGIIITIIGVSIGAKYAIDHQLISPLTRIVLGYLAGAILLFFALKLKKKYDNFSAVLLSGSMAIIYFITYLAYIFYGLIPQLPAFVLMVIITAFTVMAAINYNKQVIAHIGLVGAYAVPFLLSDGPGNVSILYSYMSIINIGILVISFQKYWKSLYYSAFGLTWFMYFVWYASKFQVSEHFSLALIFLFLFFAIFYLTFLSYKLLQSKKFEKDDIVLLLANSFLFYGIGYGIIDSHSTGENYLGLFTLCNALVHLAVSVVIYQKKLADRNLFFMVSGLVLVFITIAIPVQINGSWVTFLWAGEAALLFWIGRTKNAPVYEKISYALMILASLSIMHDWFMLGLELEKPETIITPLLNINFLTSLFFIAAFGFINAVNRNRNYHPALKSQQVLLTRVHFFIPAILILSVYFAFRMEIAAYWNQLFADSAIIINPEDQQYANHYRNYDLSRYKAIWIFNYTLFFLTSLAVINFKKIKNQQLGRINFVLIIMALFLFLTDGLLNLSNLRESYLEQELAQYYHRGIFNVLIRYISFAFVALALAACYKYFRHDYIHRESIMIFDFLLHVSVLWISSSELINWMDIANSTQSYKLGLSILWGVYSLILIALGIWKKKKYLRIGAIALFGVTLIKLFFYDISHLDTISKTVVLVSLGVLLLIISFLYNKYRNIISDESGHAAAP